MSVHSDLKNYTKESIRFHRDGHGSNYLPAVNVKVHNFISNEQVMERFGCCESTAEKVIQWVWDSQADNFWNYGGSEGEGMAQDSATYHLGAGVKVWGEGRSGGWVVVKGLPEADEWDAEAVRSWAKFEHELEAEVRYLSSWEAAEELIAINEWAIDHCAIEGMMKVAADARVA